jgi:hypothetical protein
VIGRRDRISDKLRQDIEVTERATLSGERLWLRVAVDYSARDAILRAAQLAGSDIDRDRFERLITLVDHGAPVPPVDLFIRSVGNGDSVTSCSGSPRTPSCTSATACGRSSGRWTSRRRWWISIRVSAGSADCRNSAAWAWPEAGMAEQTRRRWATVLAGLAVIYFVALLAVSLSSKTKLLPPGQPLEFCGAYIDCHLSAAVSGPS